MLRRTTRRAAVHPTIAVALVTTSALLWATIGAAHAAGSPSTPESALTVLARIPVEKERGAGYQRALFEHWIDLDGDGCNSREQVLRDESTDRPQVDPFGCKVIAGHWRSAYDGVETDDPSNFDIDHVVALKEAWDSGAWSWSAERRKAFANDTADPRTLRAVSASSNRIKSDKDPSNWVPSDKAMLCTYLSDWIAVKARWSLSMDQSEAGFIRKQLRTRCATTTIAPWPPITLPIASSGSAAAGTPAAGTSIAGTSVATIPVAASSATRASSSSTGSVVYPNCASARAAGAAPLRRGDPGYSSKLDRDGDGVACE